MQQTAEAPPSSTFAGLMAAIAMAKQKNPMPEITSWPKSAKSPALLWNDDALEDDVATLSYESALRTHARYHPSTPSNSTIFSDQSLTQASVADLLGEKSSTAVPSPASRSVSRPAASTQSAASPRSAAKSEARLDHAPSTAFERNLKDASITIRMSRAECEQLHQRAAEAGLTISAYLRSCTFEAESLRAMVKDTLAQLRPASTPVANPAAIPAMPAKSSSPSPVHRRGLPAWLPRLFTPWQAGQRVARA
jgi:hypothetical protein